MDLPIKNGDYQRVPCTISDWSPVSRWCVADAGYVPCRAPWTRLRRVLAAWCAHCANHCYHPFLGVPWGFLKWGIRKTMAFNTKMFQFRMMWCATPCFRHLHMLVVIFTNSILFYTLLYPFMCRWHCVIVVHLTSCKATLGDILKMLDWLR